MTHLPVLFGYHASDLGNSHVPLSLCRSWHASGRKVRLLVPSADDQIRYPWLRTAMGGLTQSLVYRFGSQDQPRRLAEASFFKTEADSPLVYLWAGLSLEIFKRLKARGARIVIERINCHQATARRIMTAAHEACGLINEHPISEARIMEENEKLTMADAVFCPSPMVVKSMVENGVPQEKLLATSYGWNPERFPANDRPLLAKTRPVFLFVGTMCVRKGIPLLLEAWRRAGLDGELQLCGGIEPGFRHPFEALMAAGKNVRYVPYTRDIGRLFRQADVFICPTLEEGGPMVTYEAMAHGLAPLVTAMGAGAIVQDGVSGVVLPDNHADVWAETMTAMAANPGRRHEIGAQARQRARQFTWQRVAEHRGSLLEDKFPGLCNLPTGGTVVA